MHETPKVTELGITHVNESKPNVRLLVAGTFANAAHLAVGQKRKYTGEPYIVHPAEVVRILEQHGIIDGTTLEAAWLHDVVEDTKVTEDAILTLFGIDTHYVVKTVTMEEHPANVDRAARMSLERARWRAGDHRVKNVKCADLISNGRSIIEHDPTFAVVFMNEVRLALSDLLGAKPSLHAELKKMVDDYFDNMLAERIGAKYYRTKIINDTSGVYMGAKAKGSELRIRIRKPWDKTTSQLGDLFPSNMPITLTADCRVYIGETYHPELDVELC
ncbi:GTP pyrophosphokinase [Vibrio phage pVa-21]|nr:GTP pyrophosphokinase [Vibrio phage pVa-21]